MAWPRVVSQQQPETRQQVETVDLDLEVAAIHQCVTALEVLQPESVGRVLAYVQSRFKAVYRFEEGGDARE